MGQNAHRTAQVRRPVLQRLTGLGCTFVAARGCGQDLQQPIPPPPATDGPGFVGALVLGQRRHEPDPERPPARLVLFGIGRTPIGDICRHQINQRHTMRFQRRQRRPCPDRIPRHMLPPGTRQRGPTQGRSDFRRKFRRAECALRLRCRHRPAPLCGPCLWPYKPGLRRPGRRHSTAHTKSNRQNDTYPPHGPTMRKKPPE